MAKKTILLILGLTLISLASCERSPARKKLVSKPGKVGSSVEKQLEAEKQRLETVEPSQTQAEGGEEGARSKLQVAEEQVQEVSPELAKEATEHQSASITMEEVQGDIDKALATARSFIQKREQEYHSQIDAKLNDFNKRIQELLPKAEQISNQAKQQVSTELAQLNDKIVETEQQLETLGKHNDDALSKLSQNLDLMLKQLDQNLNLEPEQDSPLEEEG